VMQKPSDCVDNAYHGIYFLQKEKKVFEK